MGAGSHPYLAITRSAETYGPVHAYLGEPKREPKPQATPNRKPLKP